MAKQKPTASGSVLITGASAGIGEEFAKVFAENGHDLVLVARREERLKELAGLLQDKYHVRVDVIAADLAKPNAAQALFDATQKLSLNIEVLVNNAGLLCEGQFTDMTMDSQLQMLQVNVNALTALSHLYAVSMQGRGSGRILNVCSTSAFQPVPTLACYAASKAYVLSFSEALNAELDGTGVSLTCLCPGFTNTDMIQQGERDKGMSLPLLKNMDADEVAKQGYEACMGRKPVYINGIANQALVAMSEMQPRWLQRLINERLAGKGF